MDPPVETTGPGGHGEGGEGRGRGRGRERRGGEGRGGEGRGRGGVFKGIVEGGDKFFMRMDTIILVRDNGGD